MADPKVVLITGAARRIGAEIARHFHEQGLSVVLHYNHSREEARSLQSELNAARSDSAACLHGDLTSEIDVQRLAYEAPQAFGRLDVLVNNASAFYPTPFGDTRDGQWEELIDTNLRAPYFLSQGLVEELKNRRGSIVNIIDSYADRPLRRHPVYSIAKAGLKAMTRALALELAPDIRVNAVSPGTILWPPALADEQNERVQRARQALLDQVPLGKVGEPRQVAATACFLALQASYMTGQVIRMDGGRLLAQA